ncbi:hypothetical protein QJS66_13005 [Kocuria rhizophila]|nr:hypothetical protein QJS66_13005 [Kocuria rhizophila]
MVMEIFGVNDDVRAHANHVAGWATRSSSRPARTAGAALPRRRDALPVDGQGQEKALVDVG